MKAAVNQRNEDNWTANECRMLRYATTTSMLVFTRYFFKKREGSRFMVNQHHREISKALERVLSGEIKRLIINIPPGYTKTEMAVINFIAAGLAINPKAKFIHASYSDDLALLNSQFVKDVVTSEEYQQLHPMQLRKDSRSKKAWFNEHGGGMLAAAAGGSITGFRAGRMTVDKSEFSGALIIDDPIKPADAYSAVKRATINNRFTNTFKSRLAHEDVAIILIMQRIHEDDPAGFLLKGGTGEKWHHLCLSAKVDSSEIYPKEYTHGIPIDVELEDGALWEYKHTLEQLKMMENSDPYTTAAQYYQRPAPLGGGIFKTTWWKYYHMLPVLEFKIITGDTAQKIKEVNDYSVFQCWGYAEAKIYLIDQIRGKWEADELKRQFISFWNKHKGNPGHTGATLRGAYIEDKSSGTGLIQDIANDNDLKIPIFPIQRNTDKVTRAMDGVPHIASGYIMLPDPEFIEAEWLSDYKDEFSKFTPLMTHKHDDQIDPTLDAISILLSNGEEEAGTW